MTKTVTLKLSVTHLWLVGKGLEMLSSPRGEEQLQKEFPNVDFSALVTDLNGLMDKIEKVIV